MVDYSDGLSKGLAGLHDLMLSEEELSEVLEARAVIDQARGMLMTRLAYDADEAFDLLKKEAHGSNEQMIVIAQRMVDSATRI